MKLPTSIKVLNGDLILFHHSVPILGLTRWEMFFSGYSLPWNYWSFSHSTYWCFQKTVSMHIIGKRTEVSSIFIRTESMLTTYNILGEKYLTHLTCRILLKVHPVYIYTTCMNNLSLISFLQLYFGGINYSQRYNQQLLINCKAK